MKCEKAQAQSFLSQAHSPCENFEGREIKAGGVVVGLQFAPVFFPTIKSCDRVSMRFENIKYSVNISISQGRFRKKERKVKPILRGISGEVRRWSGGSAHLSTLL